MRVAAGALIAILAVTSASAASVEDDHPIVKVITLLKGLKAKTQEDGLAEADKFRAFAHWCTQTAKLKSKEIEDLNDKITEETAQKEALDEQIKALADEITALTTEITEKTASRSTLSSNKDTSSTNYDAEISDLSETIRVIGEAIAKLETAKTTTTGLSAIRRVLRKALLMTGTHLSSVQRHNVHAFLQGTNATESTEEQSPYMTRTGPERKTYRFKSGGVIELLKGLQETFESKKVEKEKEKQNTFNSWELADKALEQEVEAAEASKTIKTTAEGVKKGRVGELELSIGEDAGSLKTAEDYLAEAKSMCETKQIEFEERGKVRAAEQVAIDKAVAILQQVAGVRESTDRGTVGDYESIANAKAAGKAEEAVEKEEAKEELAAPEAFLQLVRRSEDPRRKAINLLKETAKKLKDKTLAKIADQLSTKENGPFDEVKNLIQKMIFRLMAEQKDENDHKAWCDKEIKKTNTTVDGHTEKLSLIVAEIEQATNERAALNTEIADLDTNIALCRTALAEAGAMHSAEQADFEHAIRDAKDAQAAIADALRVLRAHFIKTGAVQALVQEDPDPAVVNEVAEEATKAASAAEAAPETWEGKYTAGAGIASGEGNVLDLLEQISADYDQMEMDYEAAKKESQTQFDKLTTDTEVELSGYTAEQKAKKNQVQNLTEKLSVADKSKTNLEERLRLLHQYYTDLGPACIDGDSTYEERKSAREKEIEALKQAQGILETAFKKNAAAAAEETTSFMQRNLRRH